MSLTITDVLAELDRAGVGYVHEEGENGVLAYCVACGGEMSWTEGWQRWICDRPDCRSQTDPSVIGHELFWRANPPYNNGNGHSNEFPHSPASLGNVGNGETSAEAFATRGFDLAEFQPVRHAWADRYVVGAFNVLLGEEGVGKGTLLSSLIARLTRGTLPGAYEGTPVRVLWVGDEDGWHDVVGPRLFAADADLTMVEELTHPAGRFFNVRDDADELDRIVVAGGFQVVVFEALLDHMPQQGRGGDPMQHVRASLAPTRAVFRRRYVTGIATLHTKKGTATSFRELQAGSHQYNALSRGSLLLAKDPENPQRRLIVAGKQNHSRAAITKSFKLDGSRFDLNGHKFNVPRAFDFRDEPDISIDSLLAQNRSGAVVDELIEQLREVLTSEPQQRKDIAKKVGCADDGTFDRALKSLEQAGVAEKVGRGLWIESRGSVSGVVEMQGGVTGGIA